MNKRIFDRLNIKINVRYQIIAGDQVSQECLSIAKNLSAGGLSLITHDKLEKNSILQLFIELPDSDDAIKCLSKVVRVDPIQDGAYGAGVYFLDLTGTDRKKIENFIKRET